MSEPSVADVLAGQDNPASTFGGNLGDHYKDAASGEKDHFFAETAITKVPGVGGAYKPFKDGWDAVDHFGKGDVAACAGDVAGVASDTASFASDAATAVVDPLNLLISKGLGFLEDVIFPLKEILELVTGDSDALDKSAEKFDEIAGELRKLAEHVEQTATRGARDWSGAAAPVAGKNISETKKSIADAAESAGHIATMLNVSSMLMTAAYEIINGIIADVVEQLIITWAAAQAAAPFTFGASEAAAAGASVAEVGAGVARATPKVSKVTEIIQKIIKFFEKIQEMLKATKIGKLAAKIGEPKEVGKSLSETIAKSAKDRALEQVGLSSEKPDSAFKWAKTSSDVANKGLGTFNDGRSAVEYSTDPGAKADEKGAEQQ